MRFIKLCLKSPLMIELQKVGKCVLSLEGDDPSDQLSRCRFRCFRRQDVSSGNPPWLVAFSRPFAKLGNSDCAENAGMSCRSSCLAWPKNGHLMM